MKRIIHFASASLFFVLLLPPASGAPAVLLGWNNLGMHCMDSDYSVFSILPPYNTIEAQLIVGGQLATSGSGYKVTYQALADPSGSINRTSINKGNFYQFTDRLYAPLQPDQGLAGWPMPGPANTPQPMVFEIFNSPAAGVSTPAFWFRAEGIPITPYDDVGRKNPYPMMRLVARDSANNIIATSDIVLPVSDEMDCRACHGSGTHAAARPADGWVNLASDPDRDYRLNILRLHDERRNSATWPDLLSANGFNPLGLYASVVTDNHPVLCAKCHLSEALPGSGYAGVPPLTRAVHSLHASVIDPDLGITLESSRNRAACYRCHPGSATRCLRGAMGGAVATDGSMEMQCQSCHGTMSRVGSANRVGWFMEPNCQSCHTGTATHNNGQIRYSSAFETSGAERVAVDNRFATTPNTPAAGLSLYRFSVGHGGLQCSACHGSTHAEFPSSHASDNIRNMKLQGHAGMVSDCGVCHASVPSTVHGGPHGMHPIGQSWVNAHHDAAESGGISQCRACHGLNYRGTALSRALGQRAINAFGRTIKLFRGAEIGCYLCHNGPDSDDSNGSTPPRAQNLTVTTEEAGPVSMDLTVSNPGATLRIITQPAHGRVGLSERRATYYPDPGFTGADQFTFAAYDGAKNSNLGVGTMLVGIVFTPSFPGNYAGLFSVPGDTTPDTAGSLALTVTGTGGFSGRLKLAGAAFALSGRFNPAGEATVTVKRSGAAPLYVYMRAQAIDDTVRIVGTVDSGVWQAVLTVNRAYYDGLARRAPQAGKYTMTLPAPATANSPSAGFGYATFVVSSAGRLCVTGALADGATFTRAIRISKFGEWPLSVSFNAGKGLLQGWMQFTNTADDDVQGEVTWVKPAIPSAIRYPLGFEVTGPAAGSRYTPPASGVRILNFEQGRVLLAGSASVPGIEAPFSLPTSNKPVSLSTNKLELSFVASRGVFKGSVVNPAGQKIAFKGVVLQKSNCGAGYYLTPQYSGDVQIVSP